MTLVSENRPKNSISLQLDGAPLDAIKLIAAICMLADHVNTLLLNREFLLLWCLGRISFPLFCFVMVSHLANGKEVLPYITPLLVFGFVTQPIYPWAFSDVANVLFTLAIGAVLATTIRSQSLIVQHAALGFGAIAIYCTFFQARTGVDFGLAGLLLPAAMLLVVDGHRSHIPWLIVMFVGLNWGAKAFPGDAWLVGPVRDAVFAGVGTAVTIALVLLLKEQPRFLPRYALHIFYPAHLAGILAFRSLG